MSAKDSYIEALEKHGEEDPETTLRTIELFEAFDSMPESSKNLFYKITARIFGVKEES